MSVPWGFLGHVMCISQDAAGALRATPFPNRGGGVSLAVHQRFAGRTPKIRCSLLMMSQMYMVVRHPAAAAEKRISAGQRWMLASIRSAASSASGEQRKKKIEEEGEIHL